MDHDAHVRAYHRHLIEKAFCEAMTVAVGVRMYQRAWGVRSEVRVTGVGRAWTWKNHLANWINKTVNLLEKWGL